MIDVSTAKSITLNGSDVSKITEGGVVLWEKKLPQLEAPTITVTKVDNHDYSYSVKVVVTTPDVSGVRYEFRPAETTTKYPCGWFTYMTDNADGSGENSRYTYYFEDDWRSSTYYYFSVRGMKDGYEPSDFTCYSGQVY